MKGKRCLRVLLRDHPADAESQSSHVQKLQRCGHVRPHFIASLNAHKSRSSWRWNLKPGLGAADAAALAPEEDDDEDVCGICRVAYDGCCPDCKRPGDDCPLSELFSAEAVRTLTSSCPAVFGTCTHVFHMHCLLKWLETESSKNCCPMDRKTWGQSDSLDSITKHLATLLLIALTASLVTAEHKMT